MYGVCVRAQRTERQREDGSELGPKPFALVLIGPLAWAETFCIGPLAIGPQAWAKLCIGPQAWAETFCIGPLAADEETFCIGPLGPKPFAWVLLPQTRMSILSLVISHMNLLLSLTSFVGARTRVCTCVTCNTCV